ncbi:MAG: hypothetical protein JXB05_03585 [Myxococcaceae bacterium]|nr:hypothetical protein [Myxococcaceae bacterium]
MKLAFCVEDDTDEDVFRVLLSRILATEVVPSETQYRIPELRAAAQVSEPLSWPRHGLPALRYLFAVPVQALETWLLLARGHDFKGEGEALGHDPSGRAKLKRLLYGMEHPDRDTMRSAALPIAEALDVAALAKASPSFADFLTQLR